MTRRKRPLETEEIADLVAEDVDNFWGDFDDSDSSSVSAYTDTESEPEIEADSRSDADEQTEGDDDKVNQLLKGSLFPLWAIVV